MPKRITRNLHVQINPGLCVFLGGAGVGKTREAIDFVHSLASVSGAATVYLAQGYIEAAAPLPARSDIRRIIVVVDDYDFGFPPAAASSFEERQAAYAEAIANLAKLHQRIKSLIDLHALIVTVNTHRLPMSQSDITDILPKSSCILVPAVSPTEFREFVEATGQALGLQISNEAVNSLVQNCDGRFDTIATFLNTVNRNSIIGEADVKNYATFRHTAWELFRSHLSNEQQLLYDQVQILKNFRLPTRLGYVTVLLHSAGEPTAQDEVQRLVESMWPIVEHKAIAYDGQFAPPEGRELNAKRVVEAIITMRDLRFKDRYAFQAEAKTFASYGAWMLPLNEQTAFFREFTNWFPRDRYFAFLLAQSYAAGGHPYRAVLALYKVFRQPDVRIIYSGKWIEAQCHLLLAALYETIGKRRSRNWSVHRRIEAEFSMAAALADFNYPDIGPEGFELVYTSVPADDWRKKIENENKELGYDIPTTLSVDSKRLRAMVHHRYATYLVGQTHREFDVLKHEDVVTQILPDFGEAFLICAKACNQIGDSERARNYIERAKQAGSKYLDALRFDLLISHEQWRALEVSGNMDEAKRQLQRYFDLAQSDIECQNGTFLKELEKVVHDEQHWKTSALLAAHRTKSFTPHLVYKLHSPAVSIIFPYEWKIDREVASKVQNKLAIQAVFSSQVKWDSASKSPIDASVDIVCSNQDEEMSLTAESIGILQVEGVKRQYPHHFVFHRQMDSFNLSEDVLCMWSFEFRGHWPKRGVSIAVALPEARLYLSLTCEQSGMQLFWPQLEAIETSFIEQIARHMKSKG